MLKRNNLIAAAGEEYASMISKINIPEFTKCIAQYANIPIQQLKDEVICEYLVNWAHNKKFMYDFMGGNIKVDMPITYIDEDRDYENKFLEIAQKYPVYYPWLNMFKNSSSNKIESSCFPYSTRTLIEDAFPGYHAEGTSITRFFKSKLDAPDELVTDIGRVWENARVDATFTISIDPVDIMLSSENPYNWTSCYRLENDFEESHADGCLAGVLDSATMITYIWNNEGKFTLYNKYEFKNIRYKRMRMTIGVNHDFTAIHFNLIYPGKSDYSDSFNKMIRDKVETYVANQLNKDNIWIKNQDPYFHCRRIHDEYGYSEYDGDKVYLLKDTPEGYDEINVYDTAIKCPCGCGEVYIGNDNPNYNYSGYGHTNEEHSYEDEDEWCDYADDYVSCDHDCEHCPDYNRDHATCSLDGVTACSDRDLYDAEYEGDADWCESNIVKCNPEHCAGCPLYKIHHPEECAEEKNEENQDN